MHTRQKYALNLGQDILTSEKYALNLGHVYAHLCISMNRIQGKVYPPWGWLARNLRHNNTSSEWLYLILRQT